MTAREETVLPPTDPFISDENDWWEFTLKDVKVLRPGKMLYANLLEVTEQNPVQVIGCLELKPNQVHLGAYNSLLELVTLIVTRQLSAHLPFKALDPDLLTKRILIDDVTHYAYGQAEDRSVQLWVAGKAGWYQIEAAKGYMPYFNRMVQAVDMYYFLMDKHKQGKKQINPTFKSLCEQYIYHTHGDCESREQSAEVFAAHASFLLRCMIEDDLVMEWNKTNVFLHLRRQFHDEYKLIMDQRSPKSENGDSEDEPQKSTPRHDSSAIAKSQTDAIYHMTKLLKREGHLAKRRLHLDLLTDRLSERYTFSKDDAYKIVCARASDVIERLDEEEFRWSRYVIYRELTHAATQSDTLPPALLTPLESLEDSSDDDSDIGRIHKSVLRPKATSMSSKVMGKRNRTVLSGQLDGSGDSDELDEMTDIETPSKSRGHELIRTPLPSSNMKIRSKISESSPATALLQRILRETPQPQPPQKSAVIPAATINSEHLRDLDLILEPETWICRMIGCPKTITTKGSERQKDIEDHAGEHDWETQMRVELVETEQRMRSVFPVGNLMQYLVSQHYQQMRTAFPEVYPASKETNGGDETAHEDWNGTAGSPEAQVVDSSTPTQLAEGPDHEMNETTT
ncbi:hypothetical protein N7495_005165 [Penicillium taxi]|uniref:uncharacterized protein n=1 Tax=Penicillium taxi TaxID=168475 RepID=UPI002544E83B|nr:uncharacterized protein N7495_005165 [Penicillium taxi]KAJ5893474.1 hypothetical protein N7495_005165 [Penicillium taxi]